MRCPHCHADLHLVLADGPDPERRDAWADVVNTATLREATTEPTDGEGTAEGG
jgi:hypothetical protein